MKTISENRSLLKIYLLSLLPIKAVLVQTVVVNMPFGLPNPSQFLNLFFTFLNIIFIFVYLKALLYDRYFFPLFIWFLSLSFILLIQPVFSFYFTWNYDDFAWYFRVLSWITILPLSFLAFKTKEDIFLLRKWGIIAFFIIFAGILIGNIFTIGRTAYDIGTFYMGFWASEAPLSITLLGFSSFFFLPKDSAKGHVFISKSGILLLLLNFSLLILVMKRSTILAFIISVIIIFFLLTSSKIKILSLKHFFSASVLIILLLLGSFSLVKITKPEALDLRSKDLTRMEEAGGDIRFLGSGRLFLVERYIQHFMNQPLFQKIFGVDITGLIDKKSRGYLYSDLRTSPHNDYLNVLVRSGLVGLGLYVCFFLFAFKMIFRIYRINDNIICLYTSAITLGMFVSYFIVSLGGSLQSILMLTALMMLLGANIGVAQKTDNRHSSLR